MTTILHVYIENFKFSFMWNWKIKTAVLNFVKVYAIACCFTQADRPGTMHLLQEQMYIFKLCTFWNSFPLVCMTDELQFHADSPFNYLNSLARFNASFQQAYALKASIKLAPSFAL